MRRWIWILLLAACSTTRPRGSVLVEYPEEVIRDAGRPRRFALLVGLNTFRDSSWRALRFAEKDAADVAQALSSFDEVTLLTGSDVTRERVLAALETLLTKAQATSDVVFIYFSTHGTLARTPGQDLERYLVLNTTDGRDIASTGLSVLQVVRKIEGTRAQRRVLVLDTCYSGEGKSQLSAVLEKELQGIKAPFWLEPIESVSEATLVLSASAWGEVAREDDRLAHGVFTHFFLEGLAQGDQNNDGAITATEAHDWARSRTYYFTGGQQRPTARIQMTGVDPIVLAGQRTRRGLPLLNGLAPELSGMELWIDGRHKGSLPATWSVNPGRHALQLRSPGSMSALTSSNVSLDWDQTLQIQDLLPPRRILHLGFGFGARTWPEAHGLVSSMQPAAALRAELAHWPVAHTYGALNIELGEGSAMLETLGLGFRSGSFELAVSGGARWSLSAMELKAGLRLSGAALWRRFTDPALPVEFALTPTAGAELLLSLNHGRVFHPGVSLSAGIAPMNRDGVAQMVGFIQAMLALSWSPQSM